MNTCLTTNIRLSKPAELIVALPYLVGFHPRDSLIVVCLHGSPPKIGLAVRADLPPPGQEHQLAAALVGPVARRLPEAIVLIAVGGGAAHPLLGLPGVAAVAAVSHALRRFGVQTMQALWAASADAGAEWSCYERCCGGRLPDPATTTVPAAMAAAGAVTFADRDELQGLVAAEDEAVLARRGALLDAAVEALEHDLAGNTAGVVRGHLALVLDAVEAAGRGVLPATDEHVVQLAVALADRAVRDWCLRLCCGDQVDAAERLWLALTRATPAPEVANPATLAALCAYLRGNGALAGMAVERALQAWPGHDLATLLDKALEAGLEPGELAQFASDAAADAELTMTEDAECAG
jgi:Domain of unknown function (DUF4192)